MRTSTGRRSAWPPPGRTSRPATCTSAIWRARRAPASTAAVARACCSTPSRCRTASRWAPPACAIRWCRAISSPTPSRRWRVPRGFCAFCGAVGEDKRSGCRRAGEAVVRLVREGLKPREILTRRSFENAITVVIALGGSTNAVLHLLAIAHEAGVRLELDDFTRIGRRVPVLADLKPSGRYLMSELVAIGGIQPLMKMLMGAGLLHPQCLTVTGHTLRENLEKVPMYMSDQEIVRPLSDPLKKDSHLVVLYGNLAPEGAVAKITGKEGERFKGAARVFEGEERATRAILAGRVRAGDVVVIRQEGPRGGPGMREMLSPYSHVGAIPEAARQLSVHGAAVTVRAAFLAAHAASTVRGEDRIHAPAGQNAEDGCVGKHDKGVRQAQLPGPGSGPSG